MPKKTPRAEEPVLPPKDKPVKTKLARRKVSKKTIGVIVWVIILITVGAISFTVSRNNALAENRVAEKSLNALKANDDTTLYNLGSQDFKKATDQKKVKSVVNDWHKVISQATEGDPELVSKQQSTKDNKQLTTLIYKYKIKPGKSKINQEHLYIRVVTTQEDSQHKLYTFTVDIKPAEKKDEK